MSLHYVTQQRPVTDALRQSVTEDLPEMADIGNADLRRKAVEAWAFALSHSSFGRISDIPPGGNPGMNVLKRGSQADHLRGVARLALQITDTFIAQRPEVCVDRDVVLTGALCHDVGKCYEFDPRNLARWEADPSATGQPTLRHTVFGTYVCLTVGLPEEVSAYRVRAFARGTAHWRVIRMHDRAARGSCVLVCRWRVGPADTGITAAESDTARS